MDKISYCAKVLERKKMFLESFEHYQRKNIRVCGQTGNSEKQKELRMAVQTVAEITTGPGSRIISGTGSRNNYKEESRVLVPFNIEPHNLYHLLTTNILIII